MDLLANNNERRDLSPKVTACLRAVTELLNTSFEIKIGGKEEKEEIEKLGELKLYFDGNASVNTLNDLGIPNVIDNGGDIGITSKPRVSNITFSTVTSATGLPTIAAEPSRPRSSSYWKALPSSSSNNNFSEKEQLINNNSFISLNSSSFYQNKNVKEINKNNLKRQSLTEIIEIKGKIEENLFKLKSTVEEKNIKMTGQPGIPSTSGTSNKLENVSSSSSPILTQKQLKKTLKEEYNKQNNIEQINNLKNEEEIKEGKEYFNNSEIYKTIDGTIYELNELELKYTKLGQQLQEWSFPIFNFAEKYKNTVLSRLTYAIFKEANLFQTFKISYSKFFNFFHALESGYWDIPYHNRIHAADVLHGCFYLTIHSINAFYGYNQLINEEEEEDEDDEEDEEEENNNNFELNNNLNLLNNKKQQKINELIPLSQNMSALELMALYSAAAMHDYDHPGRTNAFLVASEDKKAILYNDRSILQKLNVFVLEYILATDLKQHFDIIVQFNERAPSMNLSNESDRMLISLMIIKFADINSPSKPYSLHKQWTERICQEFYEQGDEERIKNIPISPYMDRNEPAVAKLQDSFIAHIVNPLAIALNEANLLPILPGLSESEINKLNKQQQLNNIIITTKQQQSSFSSFSSSSNLNNKIKTKLGRPLVICTIHEVFIFYKILRNLIKLINI
ncbi:Phosphodiesterase [Meloidogyne graminicola]|uniref:Phosphodiesterase n=1 Tax=Meloidogyne graminicola TaxID=189291 RepID=A0A8T0A3U1_9BILA|nr:Phosphodiesterase [Meloidogyne graminicola]